MSSTQPVVKIRKKVGTERWSIEVADFSRFIGVLGSDVVTQFGRCFLHADRLLSLTSFGYLNLKQYPEDSLAFGRNLQTMLWFVVGTLREFATAVKGVRSALAKKGILDAQSPPWVKLRAIEETWENDPFYRTLRDKLSFHVDPEVIAQGLQVLRGKEPVSIIQGDGPKDDDMSLRLGLEAFILGYNLDLADSRRLLSTVVKDHGEAAAIQEAFLLALERVGLAPVVTDGGA